MGKDAVLAGDGDDVGGDADGHKVKLLEPELVGEVELLAIALDELEADTAAGKFFVGVRTAAALGVEDGVRVGDFVPLEVVVADDDINAVAVGEGHLVVGLDAAVERDQQGEVVGVAVFDALVGNTVALEVAVLMFTMRERS